MQSHDPRQPLRSISLRNPSHVDRNQRSIGIPEAGSQAVLQDLMTRFQSFKTLSSKITDWYQRAWKDMSEELSVLVDTEASPSSKPPAKYEDLSREFQIKGSVFEGLFAAMKRSVMATEALIHNYCFKRKGRLSEAECKQGVGMALERMANEIWKLVSVQVQKPVTVRAAEALKALLRMREDSDSLVAKLKEAQKHFEEVLKRHQSATQEGALAAAQGEFSLCSDSSSSDNKPNPFPRDLSSELRDQSSRLMKSFQKYATSSRPLGLATARTDVGNVFKEMAVLAKNSKADGLKGKKEADSLAKQLGRMRLRVEEMCRTLEDAAEKKSRDSDQQETRQLRELVAKQTAEIEKMKQNLQIQHFPEDFIDVSDPQTPIEPYKPSPEPYKSSTPDPVMYQMSASPGLPTGQMIAEHLSYQISPAEPISYKEDFNKLTQTQVAMISDLKNLHKALEKLTVSPSNSLANSSSAAVSQDCAEAKSELGLGLMLKAMRTAAPHIKTGNDAEMVHQFVSETLGLRQEVGALVEAVRSMGCEVSGLKDIEAEFSKFKQQYAELAEEHDELILKVIKVQSEAELNANYYQTRLKELEAQLEEAHKHTQSPAPPSQAANPPLKSVQSLLAALPKLKQQPTHRPTDSRANYYEDEISLLSAENFAFLGKIESVTKNYARLRETVSALEKKLQTYEGQMEVFPAESGSLESSDPVDVGRSAHVDPKSSFESAPGGTEEAFDHQSGELHSPRAKKISILESPVEEVKSESAV